MRLRCPFSNVDVGYMIILECYEIALCCRRRHLLDRFCETFRQCFEGRWIGLQSVESDIFFIFAHTHGVVRGVSPYQSKCAVGPVVPIRDSHPDGLERRFGTFGTNLVIVDDERTSSPVSPAITDIVT